MNMETRLVDNIIVIKLAGRFDAYQTPQVEKCLQEVYAGKRTGSTTPKIVVDMALVNFIDSTGLATLVQAMKQCQTRKGHIILCNLQTSVRIIFELTRLYQVFSVAGSQEEALEWSRSPMFKDITPH